MIKALRKKIAGDSSSAEAIRGSATNFIIRIAGLIAGYVFTLLISRLFGASVLGAHTLSTTVLMMFTIPGKMGMDLHIVKTFSADRLEGRWDRIYETYRKTLAVAVLLGVLLSVGLYFGSSLIAAHLFKKPGLARYLEVISFAVLPMIMRFINSECYRGFGMNRQYVYSQNVGYFLYAIVLLGILSTFIENPLLPNIAFAGSLIILASSSTILVIRKIRMNTTVPSNELKAIDWVRSSAPMMMAGSILLISGWITTLVLGAFGSESDVGVFAVIIKITAFANFVLQSVNGISTPKFAQLHAQKNETALADYVQATAKIIFWASLPVIAAICLGGGLLLDFFGDGFREGLSALLIVMVGKTIGVICGSNGNLLNMTGNQKPFRNIMTAAALLNVAACFILIPKYGIIGGAIATSIFIATWNIAATVYIKTKLGIKTYYLPF